MSPVRVPIQDGSTSIGEFIFIAIFGLPSAAVLLLAIPLALAGHFIGAILALLAGGFFAAAFFGSMPPLWRTRPSDLVVEPDAIIIAGGMAGGRRLALDDIDTESSGWRPMFEGIDLGAIVLEAKGEELTIAEDVSFEDAAIVLEVVRSAQRLPERKRGAWKLPARSGEANASRQEARIRKRGEKRAQAAAKRKEQRDSAGTTPAPAAAADALDILSCAGCGAPLVPVEEDHATCRHCDARTPQPDALRERMAEVRRTRELGRAAEERLARIAAQPRARGSMIALVTLLATVAAGFLGAHAMVSRAVVLRSADVVNQALRGGVFTFALSAIAATLASAYIARRAVVRAAALGFAAIPPDRAGGAPRCHACGAPLPHDGGELLSRCGYCRATNIVAMTVPRPTHGLERANQSLEASLTEQADRWHGMRKWVAGVVPVALVVALWTGREIFDPSAERRYDRSALRECKGVAELCFAMGGVGEDRVRYMRLACDLGHGEGCMKLGAWTYLGELGLVKDEARALVHFDRSCELGFREACEVATGLREKK